MDIVMGEGCWRTIMDREHGAKLERFKKWRKMMTGERREEGRCDILCGGRGKIRVTALRRACSPWKLLWLWTSYLFNHLATLNFFPPRIKFERKIGRPACRIRSRLSFHGYIFLDQVTFLYILFLNRKFW